MSLSREELAMYGGSDAAAIAGLNPNKRPIDVFARVAAGRVDDLSDVDPVWIGEQLEPFVRAFSIRKYGWESLGPQKLIGVIRPYIRVNLDDVLRIQGEDLLGEYKTANEHTVRLYGEDGSDEFPVQHHCQTQLYFRARPDLERGFLVAFLGGLELRRYPLRRDPEMGEALVQIIDRFHTDHVLKGIPPPLDTSDSTARWLRERYPRHNGTMIAATPEADELAERLFAAREAKAQAEELEREARLQLEAIIRDADGIQGAGWKVLYRASKGTLKTDWEAACRAAGVPDEVVQQHTRITNGSRRFLPTRKE